MNTVWAFGDSMTAKLGKEGPYTTWLGYEGKTTCDFVAEKYEMESNNLGVSGSSNHQIFHRFLANFENIKKGDIVLFGWTVILRFRLASGANRNTSWRQIWAKGLTSEPEYGCVDGVHVTNEIVEQLLLNRSEFQDMYENEVNEWISFINEWAELKGVTVVHWSWCNEVIGGKQNLNLSIPVVNHRNMSQETNDAVQDGHYGQQGYYELAQQIIEYLESKK